MPFIHYRGYRTPNGCVVTVRDERSDEIPRLLAPRHDLRNHSPTGFQWGYGGSGPAQLALALLADALGDDERALQLYQVFKWRWVAHLQTDAWEITRFDIQDIVWRLNKDE
jgi:hypothetical protein